MRLAPEREDEPLSAMIESRADTDGSPRGGVVDDAIAMDERVDAGTDRGADSREEQPEPERLAGRTGACVIRGTAVQVLLVVGVINARTDSNASADNQSNQRPVFQRVAAPFFNRGDRRGRELP